MVEWAQVYTLAMIGLPYSTSVYVRCGSGPVAILSHLVISDSSNMLSSSVPVSVWSPYCDTLSMCLGLWWRWCRFFWRCWRDTGQKKTVTWRHNRQSTSLAHFWMQYAYTRVHHLLLECRDLRVWFCQFLLIKKILTQMFQQLQRLIRHFLATVN